MATVGFIGLGIMGAPMATNLAKKGFTVVGTNRTMSKATALADKGVTPAATVAETVKDADVVITVLPDSPDVEAIMLGEDGVFANAKPGTLIIDMSTIRPDVATEIAAQGENRGLKVLDAPVSGGEAGAVEGVLSIMVGGASADFDQALPVFEAMGTTIIHVGPAGSGQIVKAANQLIVAGNLAILAEAIVLLEAHHVDTTAAIKVLGGGLAGSTVLERKAKMMLERSFAPGFRLELFHKDMGIVQTAARETRVATPVGALAAQIIQSLVAQGDGGLDHSAMIKTVAELSNR